MLASQHSLQLPPRLVAQPRPRARCGAARALRVRAAAHDAPRAPLLGRRGLLNLAGCACCAQLVQPAAANQWGYGSPAGGVAEWPAVSATCAAGGAQSPIDLVTAASEAAALDTCVALPAARACAVCHVRALLAARRSC